MLPSDIGDLKKYFKLTIETIGMAITGTIFALFFVIAIGLGHFL